MLQLEPVFRNRFDPNAVAVVYKDAEQDETYLLGYIPRDRNETIAAFLEMGWEEAFECRISKINPDAHPERQLQLLIRIKKKKE